MTRIVGKTGEAQPGHTTATLERGNLTLVTRDVPARVCTNRSKVFIEESTTAYQMQDAGPDVF
jgi:hypothetical protein